MFTGQLWRHRGFTFVWAGQTLSSFGSKISAVAIPSLAIFTLDAGAFEIGALASLGLMPYLVLSPFAGVWADRLPRRSILIVTDLGRMAALASLPVAYALGALTLPHLFVVAAVTGVLSVFFDVSYQSYLPSLVGPENLVEANGKMQFTRSLADVGGFGVAGALVQALGSALAVLADACTFLASAVCLLFVRHPEPRPEPAQDPAHGGTRRILAEVGEGLDTIRKDLRLRALMLATGAANLGMATAGAVLLLYAYNEVHLSAGEVGLAFAAGSVGVLLGATTARPIANAVTLGGALLLSMTVTGLCFVAIAGTPASFALPVLLFCQLLIGMANAVYNIHVLSLVGSIVPGNLIGRVSGSALTVVHGAGAVGGLVGGTVGSIAGVRAGLATGGLLVLLAMAFIILSPVRSMAEHPVAAQPEPEPTSVA